MVGYLVWSGCEVPVVDGEEEGQGCEWSVIPFLPDTYPGNLSRSQPRQRPFPFSSGSVEGSTVPGPQPGL